jgi:ABC-type amino acid transport substrate-binding protein
MAKEAIQKKKFFWQMGFIACAIVLALMLKVTGCTSHRASEKRTTPYVIAFPRSWNNIQLYGTEQSVRGFSSDLLYEIASTVNIQVKLIMADAEAFPSLLDSGQVDGVLTAIPVDTASMEFYEFTIPYFVSGTVVVVGANSPYTKTNEFKNAVIAYDYNEGAEVTLGAKNSWLLKPYDSVTQALEDMVTGKVDGMILNFINASRLKRSLYRAKIRLLMPPLSTQNVRLAVRKGKNHELIELFNKGVLTYVKSGQYKELLDYWGIESQLPLEEKH